MTGYLKTFVEGETIKASDTNNNNEFLLARITSTADNLNSRITTINSNVGSQIETLRSDVTQQIEGVSAKTDGIVEAKKSTIMGYLMPDYSRSVSFNIGLNASYYIPVDAYVYIPKRHSGANLDMYINYNGVEYPIFRQTGQGSYMQVTSGFILIPANHYIVARGDSVEGARYYPLRGV